MAQSFTGVSKAWLSMRSTVTERLMKLDARGFHQGQGLRAQDLPFELELAILARQLGQLLPLGGGQAAIAAGIVPIRSLDLLADRPGGRPKILRQLIEAASAPVQRHHLRNSGVYNRQVSEFGTADQCVAPREHGKPTAGRDSGHRANHGECAAR
jgi:hypothetical protein